MGGSSATLFFIAGICGTAHAAMDYFEEIAVGKPCMLAVLSIGLGGNFALLYLMTSNVPTQ